MRMISVYSSNIRSIGYENGILYVRFIRGGLYSYSGVPLNEFNALMNASSKGSYFAHHIKSFYPCIKC